MECEGRAMRAYFNHDFRRGHDFHRANAGVGTLPALANLSDYQRMQIEHAKAVLQEQGAALAGRDNWRDRMQNQSLAQNRDILMNEITAPFGKRVTRVLDRMRQIDERTPAQQLNTQLASFGRERTPPVRAP